MTDPTTPATLDVGKLTAGRSVLRVTRALSCDNPYPHGTPHTEGALVVFAGLHDGFFPRPNEIELEGGMGRSFEKGRFSYIGERDDKGWIHAPEGGWSENPVPGMVVIIRFASHDDHLEWASEDAPWQKIIAFRPIEREGEALRPCPFCGGLQHHRFNSPDEFGRPSHGVQCANGDCWIGGPQCETEAEAAAAWNRRADRPPQADVEALREKVAAMAWSYRGNDRHAGPWYDGAKPTDSPAMQDAFGFADAILAAIRKGSGSSAAPIPGAATARTAGLSEGGE